MYYDLLDMDITFEASLAYVEKVLTAFEEDKYPFPPVKENLESMLGIIKKVNETNSKINKFIVLNENRRRNKVRSECRKLEAIILKQLDGLGKAEDKFKEELPNFNEMSHDELKGYVMRLLIEREALEKKEKEIAERDVKPDEPDDIHLEMKGEEKE